MRKLERRMVRCMRANLLDEAEAYLIIIALKYVDKDVLRVKGGEMSLRTLERLMEKETQKEE